MNLQAVLFVFALSTYASSQGLPQQDSLAQPSTPTQLVVEDARPQDSVVKQPQAQPAVVVTPPANPVNAINAVSQPQQSSSSSSLSSAQHPSASSHGLNNVAVLDITGSMRDFTREDLLAITSRFETELMKTQKVQVLERRNMDLILQEQGFQQSGVCNSSECQVQVGQLLGVDRIITGSINKVDKLYTLNLKMVDVESGKNIISHAIDIRGSMEDVMCGGCYEMAQIFSGLKKPENDHTVLTAEKTSLWPWIVGGLGVVAIGGGTYIVLNQKKGTETTRTINSWQ